MMWRMGLAAAMAMFLLVVEAWAGGAGVEYSADRVVEGVVDGRNVRMEGRYFHAPGMEREETTMHGMRMIRITRRDRGVVWQILPERRMYMEFSIHSAGMRMGPPDLGHADVKRTRLGEEVVNGIACTKYQVTMHAPNGGEFAGFQWLGPQGIPVKTKVSSTPGGAPLLIELRNLKIGRQDRALFTPPPGFRKMDMHGLLGGMMGR